MTAIVERIDQECNISLVEQTQKDILKYISDHDYKLNSVLPKEQELADTLGVSRVIVREALSSLRALGFIETKRKKGTVLIAPKIFNVLKVILGSGLLGRDAIKDLYELRLILELGMADFIFRYRNEQDIAYLQQIVENEEKCTESDEFRELDIKFHSGLYQMSQNKSLVEFQYLLNGLFTLYPPQTLGERKEDLVTHRTLVKLLRKGNPDAFRSAMRLHLENQFNRQEQFLQTYEKNSLEGKGESLALFDGKR